MILKAIYLLHDRSTYPSLFQYVARYKYAVGIFSHFYFSHLDIFFELQNTLANSQHWPTLGIFSLVSRQKNFRAGTIGRKIPFTKRWQILWKQFLEVSDWFTAYNRGKVFDLR